MRYLFLALLFLFFLCTGVRAETTICDNPVHPDLAAMIAFYDATFGGSWTNNTGWADGKAGTSCNPCDWYGVECDPISERVVSITLTQNNLAGDIPNEIVALTELENLRLRSNRISLFSADLSVMTKIKTLDVRSNLINEALPILGTKPNLDTLDFRSNRFTGAIPSSYNPVNFPNLVFIAISSNNINGAIPELWGGYSRLTFLALSGNNLIGNIPESFSSLDLESLFLSRNQLSGPFPNAVLSMQNIKTLDLSFNQFTGTVPNLSNFPEAIKIDLAENEFSGPLPELGVMPNLIRFELAFNNFSGSVPASYDAANFPAIGFLSLSNNQLSGSLPTALGNTTNSYILSLSSNQFTGCYPENYDIFCTPQGFSETTFFGNPGLPENGGTDFFNNDFCDDGNLCGFDCPTDLEILTFNDLIDFANEWPNCEELPGNLTVENLIDPFGNITNLRQLTRVGGVITYRNNISSRLVGIENVTYCAGLTIDDWSNLSNLGSSGNSSVFALDSINGPLILSNLPDLTSIEKLGAASYIKSIQVENTGIITINPLAAAEGTTDLTVINNDDMEAIYYGQGQRRSVAPGPLNNLTVSDNAMLTGLFGIPATSVTNNITITNNPMLAQCNATAVCAGLAQPGTTANISGNATNCVGEAAVRTSCGFLPVTWLSFTATATAKTVNLAWTTAAEENNDHYAVERSDDGRAWTEVGAVPAAEPNAEGVHNYVYTDENPGSGERFYRLRQVDLDGAEDFSVVRRVFLSAEGVSVFPNPAGDEFTVITDQPQGFTLHSADGRIVRTVQHSGARTQAQREGLKSGVYWLRFFDSGEVVRVVLR